MEKIDFDLVISNFVSTKLERLKYDNVRSANFWICCFSSTLNAIKGFFYLYSPNPQKGGGLMNTGPGWHFASVHSW